MESALVVITPSCVGRKLLVQETQINEETGEEENVVVEKASDKSLAIIERVKAAGFEVAGEQRCVLSGEEVSRYLSISGKDGNLELIDYLSSGQVIVLKVSKENGLADLKKLLGDEDPVVARDEDCAKFGEEIDKWSLRSVFGAEGVRVGILASSNSAIAARELAMFFPSSTRAWQRAVIVCSDDSFLPKYQNLVPIAVCEEIPAVFSEKYPAGKVVVVEGTNALSEIRILDEDALLYSSAEEETAKQDVLNLFGENGLPMERLLLVCLDNAQVELSERLLREYGFTILSKKGVPANQIVTISLQEGPATAYVIAKAGATVTCQKMISENALDIYTSKEFGWLFPQLDRKSEIPSAECKSFIKKANTRGSPGSEPQLVQSVLVSGLVELCKEKPAGLEAIRFLGEWLLKNNPDRQAAARAEQFLEARKMGSQPGSAPTAAPTEEIPITASNNKRSQEFVAVLGPPGAGKGTQCAQLAEKLGYEHITTGGLLRREVELQSPIGKKITAKMQAGELVDTECIVALLQKAIRRSTKSKFLIDGFPRSFDQMEAFETTIAPFSHVMVIECTPSVARERLLQRGRKDDISETIDNRFDVYRERTAPVVEHFTKLGKVRTVHQSRVGETPKEVFQYVLDKMAPEITVVVGGECRRVTKEMSGILGHRAICVPSLVREEASKGSPLGQRIHDIIERGQLVPTDVIIELLKRALVTCGGADDKFAICGFPRNLEQCAAFESSIVPAKHVLYLKSTGQATAFKEETLPLVNYMRSVGRLVEVDTTKVTSCEEVLAQAGLCAPSYVLTSPTYNFNCSVSTVDLKNAGQANPRGPLVVSGIPQTPQEAQDLFETMRGEPSIVLAHQSEQNDVVDRLALQGKLRPYTDKLFDLDLVAVLGTGALDDATRKSIVSQFASEQGYAVLDVAEAVRNMSICPGTWEATSGPHSAAAKHRMVVRAANACGKRGLVLLNCDGQYDLIASLKTQTVLVLEASSVIASARLDQSIVVEEGEDKDSILNDAVASFLEKQDSTRDFVGDMTTSCFTIECSGTRAQILQKVRDCFHVELYALCEDGNCSSKAAELTLALAKAFGIVSIDVHKLLKAQMAKGTEAGQEIQKCMATGCSIPLEVTIPMLRNEIVKHTQTGAKRFLLDGFPLLGGTGFPFAHDQLFAVQKEIGPLRLLLHFTKRVDEDGVKEPMSPELAKCIGLFQSLNKYVAVDTGLASQEISDGVSARIRLVHRNEEEARRLDCWTPGDGSPQALLQDVFDRYKPNRSSSRTAEEYYEQFELLDDGMVPIEHIFAKMKEWELENDPAEYFQDNMFISKDQWFEYVFKVLLLLDEASEEAEVETKEAVEGEGEDAAADAES